MFVTGYDAAIPSQFAGMKRLRGSIEFRQVVCAAARMCADAT